MAGEIRKQAATPAEARIEIAKARAQVVASTAALKAQIFGLPEWRRWVRKKPGLFIIGAFALGFLIGHRR